YIDVHRNRKRLFAASHVLITVRLPLRGAPRGIRFSSSGPDDTRNGRGRSSEPTRGHPDLYTFRCDNHNWPVMLRATSPHGPFLASPDASSPTNRRNR